MSNPDFVEPYWQDPDGQRRDAGPGSSGYGPSSGARASGSRRQGGPARSSRRGGGRAGDGSQPGGYGPQGQYGQPRSSGAGRPVPGPGAARDRRGSYPAAAGYRGQGREDSQVARELRDRLGVGGAAAGGRGARRPSRHAPGATSQYGPPGEYGPEQYGPDGQPAYGPGGQPGQHSTLQRERRSVRAADSWPDELRRRTGRGGGSGGGTGGRGFRHWLRSGSWWRRWTWR